MALKEYKPEKLLYSMGEVTEMFDVKPSLIRFWTDRFDILKPKKNKKGNRQFTPADVKNLEIIYHLTKERGMTLSGVEKYLKTNKDEAAREAEIVRRLQTIRGLLVEIREELKEDAEGEVSVLIPHDPDVDIMTEILVETTVTEELTVIEEEPEEMPEPEQEAVSEQEMETEMEIQPEIPNPLEFIEEVLPGEIIEDEPDTDDFWSDEQAVEEMREEEAEPEEEDISGTEETSFEGFTTEGQEPAEWSEEEEVIDEEVSVPFTAQPLFELEDTDEPQPDETPEEAQTDEEVKPTAVDTQQSLF